MGVNFKMAVQADYIAKHISHECGRGDMPHVLFAAKAYDILMANTPKAIAVLKKYKTEIDRDLKQGSVDFTYFTYKPVDA